MKPNTEHSPAMIYFGGPDEFASQDAALAGMDEWVKRIQDLAEAEGISIQAACERVWAEEDAAKAALKPKTA